MKETWKSSSKSNKAIYIIAILAGCPLAIYFDRYEKSSFLALWHFFIAPFFIAISLFLLKDFIVAIITWMKGKG